MTTDIVCAWAGVYCCGNTESRSSCICSLQAKTQQTEGMLMNVSSENLLLVQYQMQKERTYLGQYLYGMKLHPKVILRYHSTPKQTNLSTKTMQQLDFTHSDFS